MREWFISFNKKDFEYYGWFCGLAPIYVSLPTDVEAVVAPRHWALAPLLSIVEGLFGVYCLIATTVNPEYEISFPIKLTGHIESE
ncbi:MAG TPA: hypothetical protein VKP88_00495 [Candidatus Paceibacterota bacterium]|nr:hypothetical protein [Candidatus Paceibacterota bacterium]